MTLAPDNAPEPLARALRGSTVTRATIGKSGSSVFLVTGNGLSPMCLKVGRGSAAEELSEEKARLEWLTDKLPVPTVLEYVEAGTSAYLLKSVIEGADATRKVWASDVPTLVDELAHGLHQVHGVPVEGCPFDHRVRAEVERARRNMERGLVDEDDFDPQRRGRRASELFAELEQQPPYGEDLVFTHGDYSLPNVILRGGKLNGFVDVGRAGIGDRYRDLAIAGRSLAKNWGQEWVPTLFVAYGLNAVNQAKIEFYRLLDEFF
jgi:aminoglycoside phosphotransferase